MKTFRVRVIRKLRYEVEVQAETPSAAENAACHAPIPPELNVATLGDLAVMGCETILQVGEPWVYGWSGYDPENSYYGLAHRARTGRRTLRPPRGGARDA